MNKLCTMTGAAVGSYAGWYLCEGLGTTAAFLGSGVASVIGVYLGWKLARKIEE